MHCALGPTTAMWRSDDMSSGSVLLSFFSSTMASCATWRASAMCSGDATCNNARRAYYACVSRTHRYTSVTPLYPFGFGLSYTQFAYAGLTLSSQTLPADGSAPLLINATLSNVGSRASDEVVQVYVAYNGPNPGGLASVPKHTLVAFARVPALAPGAPLPLSFAITAADVALMDVAGVVRALPGPYSVWVGGGAPGCEAWGCAPLLQGGFNVTASA